MTLFCFIIVLAGIPTIVRTALRLRRVLERRVRR